jgi:hypothetical protein
MSGARSVNRGDLDARSYRGLSRTAKTVNKTYRKPLQINA